VSTLFHVSTENLENGTGTQSYQINCPVGVVSNRSRAGLPIRRKAAWQAGKMENKKYR